VAEKWLNLPSIAPHNLWKSKREAEIQPWTDNGRVLKNASGLVFITFNYEVFKSITGEWGY